MEESETTHFSPGAELIDAWWSLTQAMKRHVAPVLAREHGVDFKDFVALNIIEHGAMYPGQLCERMSLPPSNVSRVLDDLTRGGLIERHLDPKDSRRVRLSITAKGEAVLRAARASGLEMLHRGLRHLTPDQTLAFAQAVRHLAHNLGEDSSRGTPKENA